MKKIGLLLITLLVATSCAQQPVTEPTTTETTGQTETKAPASASFTLRPQQVEVAVDETFDVEAVLSVTGGKADSVDMIVYYDPTVLEVVDADDSFPGVQVTTGTLFGESYIVNTVNEGEIDVSAGSIDEAGFFEGTDTYATFTFKALAPSEESPIYFDYNPSQSGNTLDTDVILHDTASDILSETSGVNVVVK